MITKSRSFVQQFIKMEAASGILMMLATICALIIANSPLYPLYNLLLELPLTIAIGTFAIAKPLLLWINDGLMAIFFFMIGLELKREFIEGELNTIKKITMPACAAFGGMLIPALIYIICNYRDPNALKGWAIPAATDIAFSLGVLSLLGKRVPLSAKIFLTSIAIFDDIGAILIIALFYTEKISFISILITLLCFLLLLIFNWKGFTAKSIYVCIGIIMWAAMVKSGVHATLAGILLALTIPLKAHNGTSPLKEFEHDIHYAVAFVILPIFAFFNTGIHFSSITIHHITHSVPIGIALGLFLGKQIGVFSFSYLAHLLRLGSLPSQINWQIVYGISLLCGIGFTMSLFIGSLAFEYTESNILFDERIGILLGSLLSGVTGYFVIKKALN